MRRQNSLAYKLFAIYEPKRTYRNTHAPCTTDTTRFLVLSTTKVYWMPFWAISSLMGLLHDAPIAYDYAQWATNFNTKQFLCLCSVQRCPHRRTARNVVLNGNGLCMFVIFSSIMSTSLNKHSNDILDLGSVSCRVDHSASYFLRSLSSKVYALKGLCCVRIKPGGWKRFFFREHASMLVELM